MLDKAYGIIEGLAGTSGGVLSWGVGFITKYARPLLFIGLLLAVAKFFKINIKI